MPQVYTVCLATAAPGKNENQICRFEWIGANQPVAQEFQQAFEKTQVYLPRTGLAPKSST